MGTDHLNQIKVVLDFHHVELRELRKKIELITILTILIIFTILIIHLWIGSIFILKCKLAWFLSVGFQAIFIFFSSELLYVNVKKYKEKLNLTEKILHLIEKGKGKFPEDFFHEKKKFKIIKPKFLFARRFIFISILFSLSITIQFSIELPLEFGKKGIENYVYVSPTKNESIENISEAIITQSEVEEIDEFIGRIKKAVKNQSKSALLSSIIDDVPAALINLVADGLDKVVRAPKELAQSVIQEVIKTIAKELTEETFDYFVSWMKSLGNKQSINILTHIVLFDFDSWKIPVSGHYHLTQVVQNSKNISNPLIFILAYTDRVGKVSYNQSLSEKRANQIRDVLSTDGLISNKILTVGLGENVGPILTVDEIMEPENRCALVLVI